MEITDRKKLILAATVGEYIRTAEPVGSKVLSSDFACSPATIRQELGELEKVGFLVQPHTSSGRVPTDLGYRYYVDSLMKKTQLSPRDQQALHVAIGSLSENLSDAFSQISQILSSLIDYTIIVLTPDIFIESLKVVHLIMVDLDRILVVLLHSAGLNKEFLLKVPPENLNQEDLNRISKLLTDKLEGKSLTDLSEEMLASLLMSLPEYKTILTTLHSELNRLRLNNHKDRQLVMGGTSKMLKLPEFKNIEFTQKVLSTLEESKVLLGLLSYYQQQDDYKVVIGAETNIENLRDCSLVVSPIKIGGHLGGALGVLGPKRMPYDKIVPLIEQISQLVTSNLSRHSDHGTGA